MKTFADDELTDLELSEMLAAWRVPDPPESLRRRVFSQVRGESMNIQDFTFDIPASVTEPWYKSLVSNIRDLIRAPKVPSHQITARPVEVGSIWGAYSGGESRSGAISILLHAGVVALLLFVFQTPEAIHKIKDNSITYLASYRPKFPPAMQKAGGGGGGGQKMVKPVNHGAAPEFARKQFVPPAIAIPKPLLPVTPTITAQAPQIVANQYGDPLSKMLDISGGPGSNGLGAGQGGGLGGGKGDGYGPGSGGGLGAGVFRIGGDVSAPILISKVEPEYSEEARKAKYSGVVLLSTVVDEQGLPREIHVVRPLGLGLDEKAIEAVRHWRFRPALHNGRPVRVLAEIEVSFRLL